MALIGIEVYKTPATNNFFKDFLLKSKDEGLLKNPFNIKSHLSTWNEKQRFIIDITPVYPTIHYWGYVGMVLILFFKGISWLLLIPAPLVVISVLWSKPFYFMMLYFGLRKNGYKGKFKILSYEKIIEGLTGWLK